MEFYKTAENFRLTDLGKYLDYSSEATYSEDEKPYVLTESLYSSHLQKWDEKITNSETSEKVNKNSFFPKKLSENNISDDSKENFAKKYKRENILLRHQINEHKITISKLTKSNENFQEILKKYQKENKKLVKIVKYVVDEGIGELGMKDYQGDAFLCIKNMFDQIKATIIDTQAALIKEKEHVKRLKTQNFELRLENYANFNLVLKMNEKRPNHQTGCKGFDQAIRAYDEKKGSAKKHYKTNSFSGIKSELEKDDWLESFSAIKPLKNWVLKW